MATVTSNLRIGPADHGSMMTLTDFFEAEEEQGYRYELARGVLEVSEVPSDPHALLVWIILRLIAAYDLNHPGIIERAGGGGEFRFWLPGMMSGRHPDVGVVLRGTPKDWRGRRPAALAFEVVSEGREARDCDYIAKRAEYLAYGLREYWIVDPVTKSVTILIRDGDSWIERVYQDDEQAVSLVLPGFSIRVADLWHEAEVDEAAAENGNGNS
jgi:Uma2 family endonuclease